MQIFIKLQNKTIRYIVTLHQSHENKPGTTEQNRINIRATQQDKNPEMVYILPFIKFSNFVPK